MEQVSEQRRVVLYARVSHARHESRSVPEQFTDLRQAVDREGWTIMAEHSDEVSASRYTTKVRDGWPQVMAVIASGQVDALALWEISRAARDRAVYAALIAACVEANVLVYLNGRLHDPTDPDDGFSLDLGGALAVRESALTSKRTLRDVKGRAMLGRPHGSVPYGYRRVLDPTTGRAIGRQAHPEQKPVVKEIVRRLLTREPADAIAADLNRRGLLTATGKRWSGGNLSKLAVRPTYAGLRVYQGEVLPEVTGTWPALISVADHQRLRAMFADPARDKWRNSTHVRHLGSGLFLCGREGCSGRMRVIVHNPGRPNAYTCRDCYKVSRHQEPVDNLIETLLIRRLQQRDVLDYLAQVDTDPEVQAAAAEAMELRAELDGLYDDVTARPPRLSRAALIRMEPKYLGRIEDAERRARPRHVPPALYQVAGPHAEARWRALPIAERRAILAALIEVTILPAGRGSWKFDPNLIQVRRKL